MKPSSCKVRIVRSRFKSVGNLCFLRSIVIKIMKEDEELLRGKMNALVVKIIHNTETDGTSIAAAAKLMLENCAAKSIADKHTNGELF